MYARPYKDGEIASLPPHYDGVAFGEAPPPEPYENEVSASAQPSSRSVLSKLAGFDFLHGFKSFSLGTEELLLLAAAAFLFFSQDGDKECAILLLILVFLA